MLHILYQVYTLYICKCYVNSSEKRVSMETKRNLICNFLVTLTFTICTKVLDSSKEIWALDMQKLYEQLQKSQRFIWVRAYFDLSLFSFGSWRVNYLWRLEQNITARLQNKEVTRRGLSIITIKIKITIPKARNYRIFRFYLALLFVKTSQDLLDRVNLSPLLHGEYETAKYWFNTEFKRKTNWLIKTRSVIA